MKVKFVPQNVELEIKPNESVLHLAHDNGLHIKSVCKGVPSCSECRVRVTQGDYNVLPPSQKELNLIGNSWKIDGRRLSCQLKCFGDITVDLTEQIAKEHTTTKRPRGGPTGAQDDLDAPRESSAVLGAIMLEDSTQEILKKVETEPLRQQHGRNHRPQQGRPQQNANQRNDQGSGRGPQGGGNNPPGGGQRNKSGGNRNNNNNNGGGSRRGGGSGNSR
jgi:ferredoxin